MSRFNYLTLGSVSPVLISATLALALAFSGMPVAMAAQIEGHVHAKSGESLAGVFVRANHAQQDWARSVLTDDQGRFVLTDLPAGAYRVEAWRVGTSREVLQSALGEPGAPSSSSSTASLEFELEFVTDIASDVPSSTILSALPEGVEKRRLKIDCMGCHTFHQDILEDEGARIGRREWIDATARMLSFAGYHTNFPVIAPDRQGESTADMLTPYLGGPYAPKPRYGIPPPVAAEAARVVITEYALPSDADFPHDVMVDGRGRPVVTGMFSGHMLRLDPDTAEWKDLPIPVEGANPRALAIDKNGVWWVALGGPRQLARYNPRQGSWKVFDLGVYPHSVALDSRNRIWANDHFGKAPQWLVMLDPRTEDVSRFEIPVNPMPDAQGGPIGYGLRVGPDDALWGTELAGNRLFRFDPATKQFSTWDLPLDWSGPRRLDVAPDGLVWIPEFAGNALTRFDPTTQRFDRFEFSIPDALPYCARVHPLTGEVWVTLVGADAMARFLPDTERFIVHPMPSRVAMMRHMDFDRETGAVWTTYSSSPGVHPRAVRIELP